MSKMAQSATRSKPQRQPPPALFLHPSPAASHASLPSPGSGPMSPDITTAPAATGSHQVSEEQHQYQHNQRRQPAMAPAQAAGATATTATTGPSASALATGSAQRRGTLAPLQTVTPYTRRESTRATDRTDALWAEMQATLEEVELSASGGTRVFGPEHDRKLAELRAAQIALAQAWARSEADEAMETMSAAAASVSTGGAELRADGMTMADGAVNSASLPPGSAGVGTERTNRRMDEDTESDIRGARARRKANDRYFQRINQGVLDVVAKLEDVATAMRAVEQESKDVWGDESVPSSARPSLSHQ
ncbi:hypothetical protein BD289DRAFT_17111 [Coniella lustricola]|uniref:Uncharacterized protein n=1 Tax=Coniella lustricola TaxID=2025994 RepID=A0A2T3A3S4_9PEZI|nr:hypothetical protein BD289DRAFT_17111 [Coniella lustricola]